MRGWYTFLYCLVYPVFNLVHPGKVIGRENIPDGAVMICCNHTSDSDPLFLCYAFRLKHQIRAMAKIELIRIPVIGWLLSKAGIFGVDRGKSDIGAIKQAMKYLREGEKVLIFPEGTRVRSSRGDVSQPKAGAAMLAVVRRSHPAGLRAGAQALVPPHAGGDRGGLHAHRRHPQGDPGGV